MPVKVGIQVLTKGLGARQKGNSGGGRKQLQVNNESKLDWGWQCGTVGKAAAYSTGILYGHRFEARLFHLQSSSLLMPLQSSKALPKVLDLARKNLLAPSFGSAQVCPCGHLGSEMTVGRSLTFLLSM